MTSKSTPRSVILVGFMGAGKSSVGRSLAAQLGWEFEDLDARIERREGRKVEEIFETDGEAEFRHLERAGLAELISGLPSGQKRIVALGGGAFVQEPIAALIAACQIRTVFLDAGVEDLWLRCKRQCEEDGTQRPLLGSQRDFRELYEQRRPHYLRASVVHDTGGKAVEQIAAELIGALGLDREKQGEQR